MKRMRRRVLYMLLFVCAGFCTTLAIAWAAAWWRPVTHADSLIVDVKESGRGLIGHGESGPGWGAITLFGFQGEIAEGAASALPGAPPWAMTECEGPPEEHSAVSVGCGWPMISFVATCEGIAHHEPPPGGGWRSGLGPQWVEWVKWRGALGNPDPLDPPGPAQQKILPISIRPIGLLANTALWMMAWWLPIAAYVGVRRRRRAKRGECAACGYDLRGELAGGCSECGWGRR